MSTSTDIGWVVPAKPIRGLDHLGVQAPCVALYTQLLPGITNVTDRARYYSFYPWLIRSFEQRYRDHSVNAFRRVLRRAECLFTLTAVRHARVAGDGDDKRHGSGMVGRVKLLRIDEHAETIALDDYAALDGPTRYFKDPDGGLGQYYAGPLRELKVLDYASDQDRGVLGYDKRRGQELADAFGAGMPEDEFFALLEAPTIRWTDIDRLADFCPCTLRTRTTERSLLLDLFLARSDAYRVPESENRRATLGLLLDLFARDSRLTDYDPESVFRASVYTRTLANGEPWDVASALQRVQCGWATYQRNELFSLALQALFAAVLGAIEHDRSGRLRNAADAGDICVGLLPSWLRASTRRVDEVVAALRASLPAIGDWQDEEHEMQRGWRILQLGVERDALERLVDEGVWILLSLLARGPEENPYVEFAFDPDYFDPREVHLQSFSHAWRTTWSGMTIDEWVRWLAIHWGVQRHLGVALRKLRGERRDTFRIRPLEHELRIIEVPLPAATVPRLGRALQILRDLGLTEPGDEGWPTLTDAGAIEHEACLG